MKHNLDNNVCKLIKTKKEYKAEYFKEKQNVEKLLTQAKEIANDIDNSKSLKSTNLFSKFISSTDSLMSQSDSEF